MQGMGLLAIASLVVLLIPRCGTVAHAAEISFAPRVDVALGPVECTPAIDCPEAPWAIAAGDFNGDGVPDVATANNATDDVTVLLGDGDGGLAVAGVFAADFAPSGVAIGDVNDDRNVDLVVANEFSSTISVLLGNGNGTFQAPRNIDVGDLPQSVVLADLNGDAVLDVATADLLDGDSIDNGTTSILLGIGDGMFGEAVRIVVPGGPVGIAAGDLNDDTVIDLAVSATALLDFDGSDEADAGRVTVLLGNGDGTFNEHGAGLDVGQDPFGVIIEDLDGDGNADIVTANERSDTISVLRGRGDGTFETAQSYDVGAGPEAVAAADFDGDGTLDLATADAFGSGELISGSVSVLLGGGDGTFAAAQAFEVNAAPFGLVAVDLNGDRAPDIVTANFDSDDVSVLINTSEPTGPPCVGDCDGNGVVAVNELILGVNISLEQRRLDSCPVFDGGGNGSVEINELITAVNNALNGCPT